MVDCTGAAAGMAAGGKCPPARQNLKFMKGLKQLLSATREKKKPLLTGQRNLDITEKFRRELKY